MVASRWLDDEWWPNVVTGFFGGIPAPMRRVVAGLARRQVRQTYHLQGLGRHTLSEQKDFARRDLDALAGKVASSPYLLGDAPSVFDFGIAALLAGTLDNEPATWMTEVAREFPPVVDHAERVQTAMGVHCRAVE